MKAEIDETEMIDGSFAYDVMADAVGAKGTIFTVRIVCPDRNYAERLADLLQDADHMTCRRLPA